MAQRKARIYDPLSGRVLELERLILRLGTEAVAKKYGVSPSTVYKWKKGLHKPGGKTLAKSMKGFL